MEAERRTRAVADGGSAEVVRRKSDSKVGGTTGGGQGREEEGGRREDGRQGGGLHFWTRPLTLGRCDSRCGAAMAAGIRWLMMHSSPAAKRWSISAECNVLHPVCVFV